MQNEIEKIHIGDGDRMNEDIRQILIMTVAGILFCLAVTLLLLELKAVSNIERAAVVRNNAFWEEEIRE